MSFKIIPGILLSYESSTILVAYCDSDWGTCPTTHQSVTDNCVFLGNNPIDLLEDQEEDYYLFCSSVKA